LPEEEESNISQVEEQAMSNSATLLHDDFDDPLLGAGWVECRFNFGEFVTDVEELLINYENDPNIPKCFGFMWCMVKIEDGEVDRRDEL